MRRGFTLIELLVAIAIIALLIGSLLPTLSVARESARRAKCLANLKGIGVGVQLYYAQGDLLPGVLDVTDPNEDQGTPDLLEVLADFVDTPAPVREEPDDETSPWIAQPVWVCPADREQRSVRSLKRSVTRSEQYGSSYEYDFGVILVYLEGFVRPDLSRAQLQRIVTRSYERRQWPIISDQTNFHDGERPRNALFFPDMSAGQETPITTEELAVLEKEIGRDKVTRNRP